MNCAARAVKGSPGKGDAVTAEAEQTIFRAADSREVPFTQIANAMIDDANLLPLAQLALVIVLSRPRNWDTHPAWLFGRLGVARNKGYQIINNLIAHGYCVRRERTRESDGTLGPYVYLFTDIPGTIPNVAGVSQANPLPRTSERDEEPRPFSPRPSRRDVTNKERTNNKYRKGSKSKKGAGSENEGEWRTITAKSSPFFTRWLDWLAENGHRQLRDDAIKAGALVVATDYPRKGDAFPLPQVPKVDAAKAAEIIQIAGRAAA